MNRIYQTCQINENIDVQLVSDLHFANQIVLVVVPEFVSFALFAFSLCFRSKRVRSSQIGLRIHKRNRTGIQPNSINSCTLSSSSTANYRSKLYMLALMLLCISDLPSLLVWSFSVRVLPDSPFFQQAAHSIDFSLQFVSILVMLVLHSLSFGFFMMCHLKFRSVVFKVKQIFCLSSIFENHNIIKIVLISYSQSSSKSWLK